MPNMQSPTREVTITLAMEEKKDKKRKHSWSAGRERVRKRLRVYLSERAWSALRWPGRIVIRRVGAELQIRAAKGEEGYSIHNVLHGARCWCGAGVEREINAPDGIYDAVCRNGVLIVDLRAEDADRLLERK